MDIESSNVGLDRALGFVAITLCVLTVWVYAARAQAPPPTPPTFLMARPMRGEVQEKTRKDLSSFSAGVQTAAQESSREGTGAPLQTECPSEESIALSKTVPLYVHWHWLRHAQWQQDEVVDPILEAIA